jgi:hypothetical protein
MSGVTGVTSSTGAIPANTEWDLELSGSGKYTSSYGRKSDPAGSVHGVKIALRPLDRDGAFEVTISGRASVPSGFGRPMKRSFRFTQTLNLFPNAKGAFSSRSSSYPITLSLDLDPSTGKAKVCVDAPKRGGCGDRELNTRPDQREQLVFEGTGAITSLPATPRPVPKTKSCSQPERVEPCAFPKDAAAIDRFAHGVPAGIAFGPPGTYVTPGFEHSLVGRSCVELSVMRKARRANRS